MVRLRAINRVIFTGFFVVQWGMGLFLMCCLAPDL